MHLKLFSFFAILTAITYITFISITPQINAQTCTNTPVSNNSVTSSINITSEGSYYIWSRILAPDTINNSYYLQIDNGCAINVGDNSGIPANTFTWINYQNGSGSSLIQVSLTAGSHTVKMTEREGGVGIDKLIFTTDASCIPTDNGNNCPSASGTPAPALSPTPIPPTPTPSPAPSGNLTKNGGFEETGDWRAGFWTSSKGTISRTNTDKHSGSYSYMIDGASTSSSGQVYSGPINEIPVTPGDTFNYKGWYKGTNTYLVTKWFNSSGQQLLMDSYPLANTASWTQASINTKAPANAVELWVFVQTRNADIPAYFDDLEIYLTSGTQVSPTPTPTPSVTLTPSSTLTPTPSLSPTASLTPAPTLSPTPSLIPTSTPTRTPTPTSAPTPTLAPVIPSPTSAAAKGITGTYYNNKNFTGSSVTRIDPAINFNWGSGSPVNGISANTYSVVWTGYVIPKYSQEYTIYFKTDDGAKIWINGIKLIDSWKDQSAKEYSSKITLTKDQRYPVRIEYYQNWGGSTAQLRWSSASQAKEIIPQSQLNSN